MSFKFWEFPSKGIWVAWEELLFLHHQRDIAHLRTLS